jgi:hypothetical protein
MTMDADNWEPLWQIPRGWAVDPLFEAELCLALHKSRRELYESMDLDELTSWWPAYYASKHRIDAERQREADTAAERRSRMIGG